MKSYQLRQQTVTINEVEFDIQSLKDRQQFEDANNEARLLGISSATWPLFGVVWPASRVLAKSVSTQSWNHKTVLEIGCGIALSSIVLHRMGVNITATDYHPLTKRFLDNNINRNRMTPIQYQTGNWETANPLLGRFDVIIGSDVLYEPAHAGNVSRFIDLHSNLNVQVMIVDPNRQNRSSFTRHMHDLGYAHQYDRFNVVGEDQQVCKGRILHYQRNRSLAS